MIDRMRIPEPLQETDSEEIRRKLITEFQTSILSKPLENPESLERIFNYSKYSAEQRRRTEFLGDPALKLCITEALDTQFPEATTHELDVLRSLLESDAALARVAMESRVAQLLSVTKHMSRHSEGHISSLGDMVERLARVLKAEQGIEGVNDFVTRHIMPCLEKILTSYGLEVDERGEINARSDLSKSRVRVEVEERGGQWFARAHLVPEEKSIASAKSGGKTEAIRNVISTMLSKYPWIAVGLRGPGMPHYPYAGRT